MKRDCRGCFGASFNDCKDCDIDDREATVETLKKQEKNKETKVDPRINLRDYIDRIIEEVASEMCRGFCKYEAECEEALNNGKDYPCPLDRL